MRQEGERVAFAHPRKIGFYLRLRSIYDIKSQVNDDLCAGIRTGESCNQTPPTIASAAKCKNEAELAKLLAVFVVELDREHIRGK